MIICKKANLNDIESITYAIIRMNKTDKSVTKTEVQDNINRTYYLYDTEIDSIVGVISGCRISRADSVYDPMSSVMIGINRYEIRHLVYDLADEESLINLIREFLADTNDFPTLYRMNDDDKLIKMALRNNNFQYNTNLELYIRMPRANVSMIH